MIPVTGACGAYKKFPGIDNISDMRSLVDRLDISNELEIYRSIRNKETHLLGYSNNIRSA